MHKKVSSMGIVIARNSRVATVLLLNNSGEWVFPKGHMHEGETLIQTACREVAEETGVKVSEENCLGQVDQFSFYFAGEQAEKVIHVFLFVLDWQQPITINFEEGFLDGAWVPIDEALLALTHRDAQEALKKSLQRLSDHLA